MRVLTVVPHTKLQRFPAPYPRHPCVPLLTVDTNNMKCIIAVALAAAAACAAAAGPTVHSSIFGKAFVSALEVGATAPGKPRDKFLAWAASLHGTLKPVAEELQAAPFLGTVGPKPWSPVPTGVAAFIPPYLGSTINGSSFKFNTRCNRTTSVTVRMRTACPGLWCTALAAPHPDSRPLTPPSLQSMRHGADIEVRFFTSSGGPAGW